MTRKRLRQLASFVFGLLSAPLFALSQGNGLVHSIYYTSWGPLSYRVYVPPSVRADSKNVPLVVVLHGCMQDGAEIAEITQLPARADQKAMILLFPEQDRVRNPDKCWNWFLPINQARGAGEPEMVTELISSVSAEYPIDRSRRYLVGFSAGAAFASNLASCYPDVFAGVAIHSGLEFRAASTAWDARAAMDRGSPFDPILSGRAAAACDFRAGPVIPAILIHGSIDQKVVPLNLDQLLIQFAKLNDILDDGKENNSVSSTPYATKSEHVPGGLSYRVLDYGPKQELLLRKIEVDGLQHSWSGGPAGHPNSDPKGPDATGLILDFFKQTHKWKETPRWQQNLPE